MRYSTNDWKNTIFGMFLLLIVAFHSSAVYGHETKQGTLVVANSKAWKPFSYLTPDGEPQGILIDFWREYSVRNDVHVKFLLLDWEESLLAVKEGRADIHAGLIFSAERSQYLNFGTVIMPIDTQLYVNSDLLGIDVELVLKGESAMEVGLVKGGYEETFVRKHYPNAAIRLFSNNDALLKAVTNKQIFLFVADTQVSNFYMATTPDSVTFLPTLHLYSKDLRIATGDGSAKSIEEVSRNFEIVMEANKIGSSVVGFMLKPSIQRILLHLLFLR